MFSLLCSLFSFLFLPATRVCSGLLFVFQVCFCWFFIFFIYVLIFITIITFANTFI